MLVMKAWLETRWRLTALVVYLLAALALNFKAQQLPAANPRGALFMLWMLLATFVLPLGGSGVKSQSPAGFPEGLAGSTQFTIALPVTRRHLLAVRAAFGLIEAFAVTLIVACLTWTLFPSVRFAIGSADFIRAVAATLVFLALPYCASVFFTIIFDEPLALMYAGWTVMLVLWLLHHTIPALDIVRTLNQSSPFITHRLPWPQMATAAALSLLLFYASARMIQTREY
jgi:hypothetical protein